MTEKCPGCGCDLVPVGKHRVLCRRTESGHLQPHIPGFDDCFRIQLDAAQERIERLEAVVKVIRDWDVPSILRSPECMPHPGHWVSQVAKELDEALAALE